MRQYTSRDHHLEVLRLVDDGIIWKDTFLVERCPEGVPDVRPTIMDALR